MGISLFRKKRPSTSAQPEPAVPSAAPSTDGRERLTANEWARRLKFNEVQAERAAMRAGRWHDLFTEEEFIELVKGSDA